MAGSISIDVAVVAAVVAGVTLIAASLGAEWWVVLLASLGIAVIALFWLVSVTGAAVGNTVIGLRTVWAPTFLPTALWRRPRVTLDVRKGNDPLKLRPKFLAIEEAEVGDVRPLRAERLTLVVDDGTRRTILGAAVVGRDPSRVANSAGALVAIADLGRTISRTHALIEVDASGVNVTDLHSTGGTRINGEPVVPGQPTPAPWGATLQLGKRTLRLERRAHVDPPAERASSGAQ